MNCYDQGIKSYFLLVICSFIIGCDSNQNSSSPNVVNNNQELDDNNQLIEVEDSNIRLATNAKNVYENDGYLLDDKLCVKAKSGLIYRDRPDGKALGKFEYATQLKIVEHSGQNLTLNDGGTEITGEWLGTSISINGKDTVVYIFGGFLEPCFEGKIPPKLIRTVSTPLLEANEKEVVLFPTNSNKITTYNHDFKPNGFLNITDIIYVQQLAISSLEHPSHANADYCDFAKFVKIIYRNKEYIVFGKDVYAIEDIQTVNYNNNPLHILKVKNHVMGIADEHGLTSCDNGVSYVLIDYNNAISTIGNEVLLSYVNDDMQSETEGEYRVEGDSIKTDVEVGYTDEEKFYKLSIYKDKGWNYKIYNE